MNDAKIHLSERESELVQDPNWILTKRVIIDKVCTMFSQLLEHMREHIIDDTVLKTFLAYKGGKISKGENYMGLPYVILDYPAIFEKEDILVIRCMFWWGNFFSITFQAKGKYRDHYMNSLQEFLQFAKTNDYKLCVNQDEWVHHFGSDNYQEISDLNELDYDQIKTKKFLKIGKTISLTEWDKSYSFLLNSFKEINQFLSINFLNGEKGL